MSATGNKNIVLITGKPASGKSASLRNLDQSSMVYFNCDLKELPFATKFADNVPVTDPEDIIEMIQQVNEEESITGGVIDTITFLMNQFENQHVLNSSNTQKAWGDYAKFYKDFIHEIKSGTKNYAILAHEMDVLNETEAVMEKKVPVKGSVGKVGVEADFTTILSAKCIPIKKLEKYEKDNELLNITDDEREDGFKYVFQTRLTKDTTGEKMRSAMGLWSRQELYIDNDLDLVFKRLNEYYSK